MSVIQIAFKQCCLKEIFKNNIKMNVKVSNVFRTHGGRHCMHMWSFKFIKLCIFNQPLRHLITYIWRRQLFFEFNFCLNLKISVRNRELYKGTSCKARIAEVDASRKNSGVRIRESEKKSNENNESPWSLVPLALIARAHTTVPGFMRNDGFIFAAYFTRQRRRRRF